MKKVLTLLTPCCGTSIAIENSWQGQGHLAAYSPSGFYCLGYGCPNEWNLNGEQTYPDTPAS